MLSLVATGFVLVAAPLFIAMPFAYQQVERLVERSDETLNMAVRLTEQVDYFATTARGAERTTRQYLVVENPRLLETARQRAARLGEILRRIDLPEDQRLSEDFSDLETRTTSLRVQLDAEPLNPDAVMAEFADLDVAHAQAYAGVQIFLAQQRSSLQDAANRTQRVLAIPALTLAPITLLLALVFTWLVLRPFRQLSAGIGQLTAQDLDSPVSATGPLEIRELGRQLDDLRQQLAAAAESKNRFLRHMSHELKTPLASLVEGVSLLRDGTAGSLSEGQSEVAQIMTVSADQLQRRIDNLLKYNEWVDENDTPSFEAINLEQMMRQVGKGLQLVAAARNIVLVTKAHGLRIVAHAESLRVALDNLASNAIRHAPEGGEVRIIAGAADDAWQIRVEDDGPGISPEDRERIFEPFVQGSAPQFGAVRGSGVGLSLVRAAARMHGGTVRVESAASGGACFVLTIPMHTLQ